MVLLSRKISKEDLEQVDKMHLLYRAIANYASTNFIYPLDCDFGNFYRIKLENIDFEIGMLEGQGTLLFAIELK